MKVAVYAAVLGPRLADETCEQFEQFGPPLWLGAGKGPTGLPQIAMTTPP